MAFGQHDSLLINTPKYNGEAFDLIHHFQKNIEFSDALTAGQSDTISVSFTVSGMGLAENVSLLSRFNETVDESIISAVSSMPQWFPSHDYYYHTVDFPVVIWIIIKAGNVEDVQIASNSDIN